MTDNQTLPPIGSGMLDNLPGAQNGPQHAQHPSQYPNGGNPAISAPAPAQRPTAGEVRHG